MVKANDASHFWAAVTDCLVEFHSLDRGAAAQKVSDLWRQLSQAASGKYGESSFEDIIYHAEPWYIACNLAVSDLALDKHETQYDEVLRQNGLADVQSVEIGKTYLGKVVRLVEFGAFVEIFPGTDGLLHISDVAEHRVLDIHDELKEGERVLVNVINVEGNNVRLSRKAVLREEREKHGAKSVDRMETA